MIRPEEVQLTFLSYLLLEFDLVQELIKNKNANEWQVTKKHVKSYFMLF